MNTITKQDIQLIEMRVDEETKSTLSAYALWFFLGLVGAHRFYAGRPKSALVMLLLTATIVGLPISILWWLADSVVLGGILQVNREQVRDRISREILEQRGLLN